MKRTQAKKIAAAALVQTNILLDDADQFTARLDFLDHLFRNPVDERFVLFLLLPTLKATDYC